MIKMVSMVCGGVVTLLGGAYYAYDNYAPIPTPVSLTRYEKRVSECLYQYLVQIQDTRSGVDALVHVPTTTSSKRKRAVLVKNISVAAKSATTTFNQGGSIADATVGVQIRLLDNTPTLIPYVSYCVDGVLWNSDVTNWKL